MSDCLFCKIIAGDIPSNKVYEDVKVAFMGMSLKDIENLKLIKKENQS